MVNLDNFDFVCINLIHRTDRKFKISNLFRKLGILNRINWWTVEKHPLGGIYGCFESHYSIWNSDEFKRKYLCVFEDDLIERGTNTVKYFYKILQHVENGIFDKDLDFINVEPKLGFISEHIIDNIYRGEFMRLGCYIVPRHILPILCDRVRSWYGMDIDVALYKSCRIAGVFPKIFDQEIGVTDNSIKLWKEHHY